MDRTASPAWKALPKSAIRILSAIEAEIDAGNGSDAALNYLDLEAHGISTASLPTMLRLLNYVGIVDRRSGKPHLISIYSRSDRWRTLNATDVARLVAAAREVRSVEAMGWRGIAQRIHPDAGCEPDDASPQPSRRH